MNAVYYNSLSDAATLLAAWYLYTKRGMLDDVPKSAGKFAGLRDKAYAAIKEILVNKIPTVNRGRGYAPHPAVVISPVFAPYGSGSNAFPIQGSMIPEVP